LAQKAKLTNSNDDSDQEEEEAYAEEEPLKPPIPIRHSSRTPITDRYLYKLH